VPLLDHKQARALVGDQALADYELDLRGVSTAQARIAIERMLERRCSLRRAYAAPSRQGSRGALRHGPSSASALKV